MNKPILEKDTNSIPLLSAEKDGVVYTIFDQAASPEIPDNLSREAVYKEGVSIIKKTIRSGIKPYFIVNIQYLQTIRDAGVSPGRTYGNSIVSLTGSDSLTLRLNKPIKNRNPENIVVVIKNPEKYTFQPKLVLSDGKPKYLGNINLKNSIDPSDLEIFGVESFIATETMGIEPIHRDVQEIRSLSQKQVSLNDYNPTVVRKIEIPDESLPSQTVNISGPSLGEAKESQIEETLDLEIVNKKIERLANQYFWRLEEAVVSRHDFGVLNRIREKILDDILDERSLPISFRNPDFDELTGSDIMKLEDMVKEKCSVLRMFTEAATRLKNRISGVNTEMELVKPLENLPFSRDEDSLFTSLFSSNKKIDELFLKEYLTFKKDFVDRFGEKALGYHLKKGFFYYYLEIRGRV